jgi:hypothetical protein
VTAVREPSAWIKPVPAKPGVFRTEGVGRQADVELVPFYRLHRRTYAAYWDLYTPEEWRRHSDEILAAEERSRRLEAATVAFFQPGQVEIEFNPQGENSRPVQLEGRAGRRAGSWLSFDVPVDAARRMTLIVTYSRSEEQERAFEIRVDGVKIGEQTVERRSPQERGGFFDVAYPIPADAVAAKQKVTVRFQAAGEKTVAAVYGIRMVRADDAR